MKRNRVVDARALHYANLAILAERDGDYQDASTQWHRASEASLEPDTTLLYEQAAFRCERKAKQTMSATEDNVV